MPELPGHIASRVNEPLGTVLEAVGSTVLQGDSPANGDVLITTEGGRHFLSVIPHPHRLSLSEYTLALQIAKRWADANNVAVWRTSDGVFTRLSRD